MLFLQMSVITKIDEILISTELSHRAKRSKIHLEKLNHCYVMFAVIEEPGGSNGF